MQNITNLKDKVINLGDIIIKKLQDENKRLKTKVYVVENKIIDLEIENNNVNHCCHWRNVEISGIPKSVNDSQLKEKVVDILKVIIVNITSNKIEQKEKCYCLGY